MRGADANKGRRAWGAAKRTRHRVGAAPAMISAAEATNLSPPGAASDRTQACPKWSWGSSPYLAAWKEVKIWASAKTTTPAISTVRDLVSHSVDVALGFKALSHHC